ncbi:MAG: carbohydrate kinase family protein [bacterium]
MDVVSIGAVNIDLLAKVDRFPNPDQETVIRNWDMVGGGSAANVACGISRLGVTSGFIGNVGGDYFGEVLRDGLRKERVDISRLKVRSGNSGSVIAIVSEGGERILFAYSGANAKLSPENIDKNYIRAANYIFLSSIEGEEAIAAMELASRYAKEAGVKVFFDPGYIFVEKGLKRLEGVLNKATIVKFNETEIRELTKREELLDASETIAEYGPKIVLTTLGERGCFLYSGSVKKFVESYREFISIDKTGAGDAFSCGFIFGDLKDWDLEKSTKFANLIASISITRIGARSVPYLEELKGYKEYNEFL